MPARSLVILYAYSNGGFASKLCWFLRSYAMAIFHTRAFACVIQKVFLQDKCCIIFNVLLYNIRLLYSVTFLLFSDLH